MENERTQARTREAVVLRDKVDKTRIVSVTRLFRHPKLQKVIRKRVKYAVHDEKNESHTGDKIRIIEIRPLSRTKRWRMVKVVEKAKHSEAVLLRKQ
ncbi:MAG: 30S ribosomal protein S17 [Candidatus Omnitrophica bacterium]|nr:30S ribosomal protein S17 [Candidatus Omnitrophota bacterium]